VRCAPIGTAALALFGVASGLGLHAAELRKGPYLVYQNQPDQMLVMWQGSASPEHGSWIAWGESEQYERGRRAVDENSAQDHEHLYQFTLGPLKAGTSYLYEVTLDDDRRRGKLLAPMAVGGGELLVYALGDTRSVWGVHEQVIGALLADRQMLASIEQAIVLHAGDWVEYGDLEGYWDANVFGPDNPNFRALMAQLPVLGIRGNHDYKPSLFEKYLRYPFASATEHETYYAFDYGPVHVAALDYLTDYDAQTKQYVWLRQDLEQAHAPLKIVLMHSSPRPTGGLHPADAIAQQDLQPLFERTGVDLVISGHNHYYTRSEVGGISYITTGGGGEELYGSVGNPEVAMLDLSHHFVRLQVNGTTVELTAIRVDGTVIESVLWSTDHGPDDAGCGCTQSAGHVFSSVPLFALIVLGRRRRRMVP